MSLERRHCGATGNGMDKDSKGQRKLEDSGAGLLPAVEGLSLGQQGAVWTRIAKDRESWRTLCAWQLPGVEGHSLE